MTIRNLEHLFNPTSVAVIGASKRPHSVGQTVMRNLLISGFDGPILPVNPHYDTVSGVLAYPDVASLPLAPDLAIICTPPKTVPDLIRQLGERGTRAAVVLTAGFEMIEEDGRDFRQECLDAAKPYLLRILGPNCVGILSPHINLNASFAPTISAPGKVAFVSQSGALATAALEWAKEKEVGFSHFVSLGNCWDVDFGDVLDFLGGDPHTHAVLLYMESLTSARKFMSAARAAARNKPVIIVKSGRDADGAAAAASHTGALAGADDIYEAAIRRAGLLRVDRVEDLFNAAELLGRGIRLHGNRLAVVTNGGGIGVMAADALSRHDARLAPLSDDTIQQLDAVLPSNWSRGNPIDIIGDAPAERYAACFDALTKAKEIDAVLLLQAPTAIVPTTEIAEALAEKLKDFRIPVLSCWLGGEPARKAAQIFSAARLSTFPSPEDAVDAFMQLVEFNQNQTMLTETPPSITDHTQPDKMAARAILDHAKAERREMLSEPEAKAILTHYGIPTVETRVVTDENEAVEIAQKLGYPVALKILSDEISHKSDVGGVVLDITSAPILCNVMDGMRNRVQRLKPDATIKGFTLQPMVRRPQSEEIIVGAKTDPVFGPVILFGHGGTATEITADRAIELPPLNLSLARQLVDRTRIGLRLKGYRDHKSADLDAIHDSLIKLSQLIIDLPDIEEIDINPLLADAQGVIALDARIRVCVDCAPEESRLVIHPYPQELEESVSLDDMTLVLRPIRPEDEAQHRAFLDKLTPEDIYFRFFGAIRQFEHTQLARLTQIDYDREMAFIAVADNAQGQEETLGVVRLVSDPDRVTAEFAIIVNSTIKGRGLGKLLMNKMIDHCRSQGIATIKGQVLAENKRMLALANSLDFEKHATEESGIWSVELHLKAGE